VDRDICARAVCDYLCARLDAHPVHAAVHKRNRKALCPRIVLRLPDVDRAKFACFTAIFET